MPQSGLCADSRCNGEIRRLYECHCCSQLICLTHLNEHEEKEKFHLLTQQLRTNIDLIQLSIENRLKRIEQETIFVERERKYLQQANLFLDGRSFPIEDIQKILQDFDQLVQSQSSLNVVKIEPFISNCSSPFQFNGAYGFSREKHSIDLCPNKKCRPIGLFGHFKHKHKLKLIIVRRLIDAITKNEDPKTTRLFNDDEDIIDHSLIIECPFRGGMIDLFDCRNNKSIKGVPCGFQSVPTNSLRYHLKHHHHLSKDLAAKLFQHCKDNRT